MRWRFISLRCFLRSKQDCHSCRRSMVTSWRIIPNLHCCQRHRSKSLLGRQGFQTCINFNQLWSQVWHRLHVPRRFQILPQGSTQSLGCYWFSQSDVQLWRCFFYPPWIRRTCHQCHCFNVLRNVWGQATARTVGWFLRIWSVSLIPSVLPLPGKLGRKENRLKIQTNLVYVVPMRTILRLIEKLLHKIFLSKINKHNFWTLYTHPDVLYSYTPHHICSDLCKLAPSNEERIARKYVYITI